jgi:hypothetical protein
MHPPMLACIPTGCCPTCFPLHLLTHAVTFVAMGNGAPDLSANISAVRNGSVQLSAGALTGEGGRAAHSDSLECDALRGGRRAGSWSRIDNGTTIHVVNSTASQAPPCLSSAWWPLK